MVRSTVLCAKRGKMNLSVLNVELNLNVQPPNELDKFSGAEMKK